MINATAEQNKEFHTKSVNFEKAKLQDLFSSGLHCHIYSVNIHFIPNCLPSCLTVGSQQHVKEQTPTVRRIKLPRKATDSSQNSGPNTTIFSTNTFKSMPFWTCLKVGQNSFTLIKLLVTSSIWVPGSNAVVHIFFLVIADTSVRHSSAINSRLPEGIILDSHHCYYFIENYTDALAHIIFSFLFFFCLIKNLHIISFKA